MTNEIVTNFTIWGRELPIKITYDCFEGEEVTEVQKETYEQVMCNLDIILEEAHEMFKNYCFKFYKEQMDDDFENIFRYIKPKELYIKRSSIGKKIAGLLCNFKFDLEHGLVAYIEDGKVTKIDTQDIIL